MKVIGLTGQSGAGKSIVSRTFSACGFAVIDCDLVAREVVEAGSPALEKLCECFGSAILCNGVLNRRLLGEMVFTDSKKLRLLNQITHPFILARIRQKLQDFAKDGYAVAVLDAPTLLESGADALCNRIVAVLADVNLRLARIQQRDGLSKEQALHRINSQNKDDFYIEKAQDLLYNNKSEENLIADARLLADAILAERET